jgi:hypothetical protein
MSAQEPTSFFEFSEVHNAEFTAVAYWMRIMGRMAVFFGILAALTILRANVPGLIGGIVGIVLGIWTLMAASSFRSISTTEGRDLDHLIEAVVNLKKLYRLQAIMVLSYALLLIGLFAYGVFVALRG